METISRYLLIFLLNAAWQIPVIAAVAALISRAMRNGPAAHRHTVWVAALAASLLLPLASVGSADRIARGPFATAAGPELTVSHVPLSPTGGRSSLGQESRGNRTIAYAQDTATILANLYLLFLLFRLARFGWAWARTVRVRDNAGLREAPAPVRRVWERCQRAFGVSDAELLSSPALASPVAAGAWRRSIVLPESLFASGSEDVLTTAIGHEMAHLARHDFLLNVVYEILYLPVAFHPAAWLILRGIEETREMACDELVTRKLLDAEVYARSIVSIAATMAAVPKPGYTLGVFDGDILEQRIRRLMQRRAANLKQARLVLAAGLSTLVLCALIAGGVSWTARAQTNDLAEKVKAARTLLDSAMMKPRDAQLLSDTRNAFLDVLSRDPANQEGLSGMMTLSIISKQPQEARQWALKMVAQYPQERTAYYNVGFTDWSVVYPQVMAARSALHMQPQDSNFITDPATRQQLRGQYGPIVDEGIHMLETALQKDANYGDAMAYINLLYRMKANMTETPAESTKAVAQADDWVDKALAVKRNGTDSSHANTWTVAPPPPPPPPPPPGGQPLALPAGRVRVEGNVQNQKIVNHVDPVYPAMAQQANITGTVALDVVIGKDGSVRDVRIIGGPAPLVESAINAVRQWKFEPTLLNGVPVEVSTVENVTFGH